LFWENDERMGRIIVPDAVQTTIRERRMPEAADFPIIFAIGYGVLLAGETRRPLCLTGDRTAWDDAWGRLIEREARSKPQWRN
jgi:hypothetical protein